MNDFDRGYVQFLAIHVEGWMVSEDIACSSGRFEEAAFCAENAEKLAGYAFEAVTGALFPTPPADTRAPLSGVAGAGGDFIEPGCAGAV